jgi:hypothetical protein
MMIIQFERKWLSSFKIALIVCAGEILLLALGSSMPSRSMARPVLLFVPFVLLAPSEILMDMLFSGPSHNLLVPMLIIVFTFVFYLLVARLTLTILHTLRNSSLKRK